MALSASGSSLVTRRVRAACLLPLGAFAVHQGRYYAAFGPRGGHVLEQQGHAYLGNVELPVVLLAAAVIGEGLYRLARAWRAGEQPRDRADVGTVKLWAVAAAALLGLYVAQETLEGLLASGHPEGLVGIFGAGGWIAAPLALAVGGLIALALRGAEAIVALLAARRVRSANGDVVAPFRPGEVVIPARRAPLADRAAGRAPPLALVTMA